MSITSRSFLILTVTCAAAAVGCSSPKSETATDAGGDRRVAASDPKATTFPVPAESKFAQLRYGMGTSEVEDLIGAPTDADHRITGKAFNPFYYGTDTNRQTWFYKGEGRLVFNSRGRLIEAQHNASERGYR